jgi:hypothetical protein
MPMMPEVLSIKELDATGSEYDAQKLKMYWAMYAGGQFFRDVIDEMIIKRAVEKKGSQLGNRSYEERKARACYINRVGGFIDWAVAEICKDDPHIEVEGGTEEQQEFWAQMNKNADGYGTPFAAIVRRLLVDEMVSRLAWVGVRQDDEDPAMLYMSRINPCNVLDWERSVDDGMLTYAKIRVATPYRPTQYLPANGELVRWLIYTPGQTATYEALCVKGVYKDESGRSISQAQLVDVESYEIDIPVHSAQVQRSQWVVDRVFDPAKLLFNHELDQSFALAEASYPQMVLTVENRNNIEGIIKSELNAIVLETGDSIDYLLPEKWAFDPLDRQINNLKTALHETIQLMAKEAAGLPQAGRMSGETVREIRQPVISLLHSYAWPVHEVLMRVIEQIKDIRREPELDVKISGLFPDDIDDENEMMEGSTNGRGIDAGRTEEEGAEAEDGAGESEVEQ